MTEQTNVPQRLLAVAEQTEMLVELLIAIAPQDTTVNELARRLLDVAASLHGASVQRAAINRALDMAESLRRCTGATAVTVRDSGVTVTSTTDR